MKVHGSPFWYELTSAKGGLEKAGSFYTDLIGWEIADAGMEGFTYHLANSGGDMVAGMAEPMPGTEVPPSWLLYFAVDVADEAVEKIKSLGGSIVVEPMNIPGTGRFAIARDPQGGHFGILQPEPMEEGPPTGRAYDPSKLGHGCWHELMTTDPEAGFAFYAKLFGWEKSTAMDMGPMGTYQVFSHDGQDIGGIMGMASSPIPAWLPYFGVQSASVSAEKAKSLGGKIVNGPMEVPMEMFALVLSDPQGAHFCLLGKK